jgi:putative membrane protein
MDSTIEGQPVVRTVTPESPAAPWVIGVLSVVVVAAVTIVLYALPGRDSTSGTPGVLATVNAILNGGTACFLLTGYVFIRRRNIKAHRACMLTAFALSSLFLVTYLLHHAQVGSVPFQHDGWIRGVYYAVLIPHVILAAAIVPLALFTIYRGWTGRIEKHRKIARWTLPLWLYVSVSGVTVYLMLYHL